MIGAPVVLVTGVAEAPMAAATLALQWDLPGAVVVQHRIDVAAQQLHRVVSDITGVLDRAVTDLEHACVSCAIREDVVPTLRRLSSDGRWESVIAHLPVGAEAGQVCAVTAHDPALGGVRIASVVAALDGAAVVADLLGDDLLVERGLHSGEDDERGVGEVGAALVEYADVVAFSGAPDAQAQALVTTLAWPGVRVVRDCSDLDASVVLAPRRHHDEVEAWVDDVRRSGVGDSARDGVWTLDLSSDRPLHPQRLQAAIEEIGGGPRRSRGCFWLPSRPGEICGWDGAGGQLSVGSAGSWGLERPVTRIVVVGLDDGAAQVRAAFERCLLTPAEIEARGAFWEVSDDGFEPWLGPIHRAA